jgi:MarR family transcriptional regulator, organic hydroperoxide resistance regulator
MARSRATKSKMTQEGAANGGSFEDFLPYLITMLAHQLNMDLVEKLRAEGINLARWRILAVLTMEDGITIGRIVERAMMEQSALSRVLMSMEAEGYVHRKARPDDARFVEVYLTEKGRKLFGVLEPLVRRRQTRLLNGLTPEEVDGAIALMRRLSANMRD